MDVTVGGIRFDALQVGVRVLWEIKTHQFDKYNSFVQRMEIDKELKQIKKELAIATACGYDFVIGVSTQAHKDALLQRDQSLNIIVTGCTMTKQRTLDLIVYAPALVGKDGRTVDVIHGVENALPGVRLAWRLSAGGRPIPLPQRDAWLVENIEDGEFPMVCNGDVRYPITVRPRAGINFQFG